MEADALSRLPMDQKATETMFNYPPMNSQNPLLNKNPLDLQYIQLWQERDDELQKVNQEDNNFMKLIIKDTELVHHKSNEEETPKIVIPNALQYTAIRWMHSILGHAGISRLTATLRKHFWFQQITKQFTQFVQRCEHCQRFNKQTVKY